MFISAVKLALMGSDSILGPASSGYLRTFSFFVFPHSLLSTGYCSLVNTSEKNLKMSHIKPGTYLMLKKIQEIHSTAHIYLYSILFYLQKQMTN